MNTQNELLLPILLSIILSILIILPIFYYYYKVRKVKTEKRRNAYIELTKRLQVAFVESTIDNFTDLTDFIDGFIEVEILKFKDPYDLRSLLNSVKHDVSISSHIMKHNILSKINSIISELEELISELELKDPFEKVPTVERNYLIDILELSTKKNNKVFKDKLYKLGQLIVNKTEKLEEANDKSETALKISRRSRIWNVVVTFISVALAIYSIIITLSS